MEDSCLVSIFLDYHLKSIIMAPARGNENPPLISPAPVYSRGSNKLFLFCAQAAEGKVLDEEPTLPGEPPGVYGCDYKGLTRIAILHAGARLDLLKGDSAVRAALQPLHQRSVTFCILWKEVCPARRALLFHVCGPAICWALAGHAKTEIYICLRQNGG